MAVNIKEGKRKNLSWIKRLNPGHNGTEIGEEFFELRIGVIFSAMSCV